MAFPVVVDADTTTGTVDANSSSWTLTYPANSANGNLLYLVAGIDNSASTSLPSGWVKLVDDSSDGVEKLLIAYKRADGTETGNFTLTLGSAEEGAWVIQRITGAHASTNPEASSVATGNDANPNPGTLTPSWGAADTLWVPAYAQDGNGVGSAAPTNYTNLVVGDGGNASNGASFGTARRELNGTSQDPGTFTSSRSDNWVAYTTAIRPAAGADRTAADSPSTSDSVSRVFVGLRTASDAPTTSDSVSRVFVGQRTTSDAPVVSDSVARVFVGSRTTTDAPATSDSVSRILQAQRSASDTVATSDSVGAIQSLQRTAVDAVTTSDSPVAVNTLNRTAADSATTSDSATRTLGSLRSLADAPSTSDAATRVLAGLRTATDAVTTSDSVAGTSAEPAFQADAFQNDAFQVAPSGGGVARTAADSVTTSDSATRALVLLRTALDSVTTSETATRTGIFLRTAADSVTTSDAVIATLAARTAADSVTTSDSIDWTADLQRTAADAPSVSDSASRLLDAQRSASDAVTLSDAVVASRTVFVTAADAVSTSDSVVQVRALVRSASETVTFTSSVDFLFVGTRTATDLVRVADGIQIIPAVIGNSFIEVFIDGIDYVHDGDSIVFESARFESLVNGQPGTGYVRVRDANRTKSFVPGLPVLLKINGDPVWRGFVSSVQRVFITSVIDIGQFGLTRFIDLQLVDVNILFSRRIVFNAADPANVYGTLYPANTDDSIAIDDLVTNFLDLTGDDIDTSLLVQTVGTLDPEQEARAWSGGDTWGQAMDSIRKIPAAIYYLSPTLTGANFVYCDDDTADAPFGLSDQPDYVTTFGYREMEVLKDGASLANDVMCWGIGYGLNEPVFVRAEDATSQAEHGLWQYAQRVNGVYVQGTIDRIADSILNGSPENLRGRKDDKFSAIVTTFQPGLLPAQKVPFTSAVFGYSDVLPVRKMGISFVNPTTPKYALTLSHDIDAPWSFFDAWRLNFLLPPFPPFPPPPGPVGCDCGITDDFQNRTTLPGGGWDTASSGHGWDLSSEPSQPTIESSQVTAGYGLIQVSVPSSGDIGANCVRSLLLNTTMPNFLMTLNFRINTVSSNQEFHLFSADYDFDLTITSNGAQGNIAFDGGNVAKSDWSAGVWYTLKIENNQNTNVSRLKLWETSGPEPGTWTITDAFGSNSGLSSAPDIRVRRTNAGGGMTTFPQSAVEMDFDDYNLTDDGDGIGDINRCTFSRYDNFDRTVNNGWGSSTSDVSWAPATVNAAGLAVNTVSGTMASGTSTASLTSAGTASNGIGITAGDRTIRARFSLSAVTGNSGNPNTYQTLMKLTDYGNGTYVELVVRTNGPDAGPLLRMEDGSGVTSVPITLASSRQYYLIWETNYVSGHYGVKVYPVFDPEPAGWLLETNETGLTPGAAGLKVETFWDGTGNRTLTVDWLDFDYVGEPCYQVCTPDTAVFDDFNRTVGGNSWGTSTYGLPWDLYDSDPQLVMSVNGSSGVCVATETTSDTGVDLNQLRVISSTGPWADEFTMTTRFFIEPSVIPAPPPSTQEQNAYIGFVARDSVHVAQVAWKFHGAGFGASAHPALFADAVNIPFAPSGDGWYLAKWHFRPQSISEVRVWKEGTQEPATYQVSTIPTSLLTAPTRFEVYFQFRTTDAWASNFVHTWNVDTIDFVTGVTCIPVPPSSGLPLGSDVRGHFCETPTRVDSTHYTTSQTFVPGTTEVYVNGYRQRGGIAREYTEDTGNASITFADPVSASAIVWLCYYVAVTVVGI